MSARSLLVGATGQIGRQMLGRLGERALPTTRASQCDPGWLRLDLSAIASRDDAERGLEGVELDAIFCLAGMTNVEACEDQEALALRVNVEAPGALAAVARGRGVPFVYFSTDYVFDGVDGPYDEEDDVNPLSVYGKSKWRGEIRVREQHAGALILRTTVVYGQDVAEKNFVYSLMHRLREGGTMRVAEDQISTPTYNMDLAMVTEALVDQGASGIYHVCGPEVLSRVEFARKVAMALGLDAGLIEGAATSELGQRAPRPLRAGLRTERLRREFPSLELRTVAESIAECMPAMKRFLAGG
jgi:dTDP-4-dehydrorhamnose reductase